MKTLARWIKRALLYGVVTVFCFFSASPFLWMIITMFKQDRDLYRSANNPFIFNLPPTLSHLDLLINNTNFLVFLRNSVLIGVLVVIITLVISIPAAYSLARSVGRWGERVPGLAYSSSIWFPLRFSLSPFRVWSYRLGCTIPCGQWFWCILQLPFPSVPGY